MSSTQQIANRLVELCREGKYEQCYDELFAADAQNIEMPAMAEGLRGVTYQAKLGSLADKSARVARLKFSLSPT